MINLIGVQIHLIRYNIFGLLLAFDFGRWPQLCYFPNKVGSGYWPAVGFGIAGVYANTSSAVIPLVKNEAHYSAWSLDFNFGIVANAKAKHGISS